MDGFALRILVIHCSAQIVKFGRYCEDNVINRPFLELQQSQLFIQELDRSLESLLSRSDRFEDIQLGCRDDFRRVSVNSEIRSKSSFVIAPRKRLVVVVTVHTF
ncbi:MAG: hypothetical protein KIS67_25495 [Verrucomicrobiae bacterium]|nr:hypothetical protein [Verrucomicrobiae bacterium]